MKWVLIILGVFVGIIVIAVATLAVLSSRDDANHMRNSVVIHEKPEAIWPWLYEPDKLKTWVSWLVEVRRESNGEPAQGTRSVWVMEDRNNNNARMEIASEVERVESQRLLAVNLSVAGAFRGKASYTLTPLADGSTRVECEGRYDFDNRFARLMTPLIMSQAGKKMTADLDHLRSNVEASRSAAAPAPVR